MSSEQALACGIEPQTFLRLCRTLPESQRAELRNLCRSDFMRARDGLQAASEAGDRRGMLRELHIIISLGGTSGAYGLTREAGALQEVLRDDATADHREQVRSIGVLIGCACDYFGAIEFDEDACNR